MDLNPGLGTPQEHEQPGRLARDGPFSMNEMSISKLLHPSGFHYTIYSFRANGQERIHL